VKLFWLRKRMESSLNKNWLQKIISLPPPHQFLLITIIFIGGIFFSSFLNFQIAIFIGLFIF